MLAAQLATNRVSMKFSIIHNFFPNNIVLERALARYVQLASAQIDGQILPDQNVLKPDNFNNTRGNYEQYQYDLKLLDDARAFFSVLVTDDVRSDNPLGWADTHNHLGNILAALAQRDGNTALYALAEKSFNHALEEFKQDAKPYKWAATQYNLGIVYQALGRTFKKQKFFKQSVDAFTQALLEWKRQNAPEEWASSMFHLGLSLHGQGSFMKGHRTFQKAVVAYKNALAEYNADLTPLELSSTHLNRGAVLHHLGESEENAERLKEAIRSYETAQLVLLEQQQPFHLSVLCRINLSTARLVLAIMNDDAIKVEDAADEFELILACFPHALQPASVTYCEQQLAKAQAFKPSA